MYRPGHLATCLESQPLAFGASVAYIARPYLKKFLKKIFFALLGLEIRAFNLSHSSSPIFVIGLFEIGSHKLVAQASFERQSS
jgi:hypothetical protein